MRIDRRTAVAGIGAGLGALAAGPVSAAGPAGGVLRFPRGFLWGAATAGHQIEGNNVGSDFWTMETVTPTMFAEKSGDALNGFELWEADLDLAKSLGLNAYRFSLEWARIEPEEGLFSVAMLDHYKRIAEGSRRRGMAPVVTFNHFTCPRWFAARGGWANPGSPSLFARFCERAARHLGSLPAYAITLNEPNTPQVMQGVLPEAMTAVMGRMLAASAKAAGSDRFSTLMCFDPADYRAVTTNLLSAHKAGREAIKSAAPQLPVGVSLALSDEQALPGGEAMRDRARRERYGAWLDLARDDDFIGVQNYARAVWDATGPVATPADARRNFMGTEVHAPSLAGAVLYAHEATGKPVLISEHGVGTDDDALRAEFIPASLRALHLAMDRAPVLGYVHWSLMDNYEWVFGYKPRFGLCSVDRTTFKRTPKPSAFVLARIAKANAV